MNYVDIARNINAGRGIVQNSLGFNQIHFSPTDQIPSPVTSQPPLYPLLIAAVSQFGIPEASASLLVAVFSYALGLLVAYLLARELYNGDPTALLSVSFLLNYYPLALVSSFAWSESVGIAIVLLFMWLLALRHRLKETSLVTSNRTLFVAGLAAGLAFSTRYGLLPVFLLGILVLLVEKDNGNQKLRDLTWYVVGFALPASAVLVRNYYLSRAFMGGNPNPSSLGPGDNLRDVLSAVFGHFFAGTGAPLQLGALLLTGLIICAWLVYHRTWLSTVRTVFLSHRRYMLTIWPLGYLVFLVYLRSRYHFDEIDVRLIAPAGVTLTMLVTALLVQVMKGKRQLLALLAIILVLVPTIREIRFMLTHQAQNLEDRITRSERLSWVAYNTTNRDLIIGDDTVDIPFFFEGRHSVSFSPYPYTDYLDYGKLIAFVGEHCREYDHQYLILRSAPGSNEDWERLFGPFIANVVTGRVQDYPGIVFRCSLNDASVYELQCHF
jgi:hypothetical protein